MAKKSRTRNDIARPHKVRYQYAPPLTVYEAADWLGISVTTMYRLLRTEQIKATHRANHWYISQQALADYAGCYDPATPATDTPTYEFETYCDPRGGRDEERPIRIRRYQGGAA